MTALDWQRDRTRRRILEQAAHQLPRGVTNAAYPGTCKLCGRPYDRGAKIKRAIDGWAHPKCAVKEHDQLT